MFPRRAIVAVPALFAAVAALAALPPTRAIAGVTFGSPVAIEPGPISARADQTEPQAAFNAGTSNALMVWRDTRNGTGDIFGARLSPSGAVLDGNGFLIAGGGTDQSQPAVASDGTNWIVLWTDGTGTADILAKRVNGSGQLLDASPISVITTQGRQSHASVAWDGSLYMVVAVSDTGSGLPLLRGKTINSAGTVFGTGSGSVLTTLHADLPVIAATDTGLVVFQTQRLGNADIFAMRVRGVAGANPIVKIGTEFALNTNTTAQTRPHVAARSGGWFAVWEDARVAANGLDIRGTRVSRAGSVLDDATIQIAPASLADIHPAAYWNGTDWVTTWTRNASEQRTRLVGQDGVPTTGPVVIEDLPGRITGQACFSPGATKPLVAHVVDNGDDLDVVGRQIDGGLGFGSMKVFANQTPNQERPSVVYGSREWFVAWTDDRSGVRQTRVGWTSGSKLEQPASYRWANPAVGAVQSDPCVAYDGFNYYAFWSDARLGSPTRIRAAIFDDSHTLLDTIVVSTGGTGPQITPTCASIGDIVVVAWSDGRSGQFEVWARRVQDGTLLGSEIRLSNDAVSANDLRPSLAPMFGDAILCGFDRTGSDRRIMGTVLDNVSTSPAATVYAYYVAPPNTTPSEVSVAYNGVRNLVVWQDAPTAVPMPTYQMKAIRVFEDRTFTGVMTLGSPSDSVATPAFTNAGYDWAGLWSRDIGGGNLDLFGTAIEAGGVDTQAAGIAATSGTADDTGPALGKGPSDSLGGAFERFVSGGSWNGKQGYVLAGRDSLVNRLVINEFHVNPPIGRREFYELLNKMGRTVDLHRWILFSNARRDTILCPSPPSCTAAILPGGYYVDSTFTSTGSPDGFFSNRHGRLRLQSPGGVSVDRAAYGDSGGATVSSALPRLFFFPPRAPIETESTPGAFGTLVDPESVIVTTSRLPDGSDTDDDAVDFNLEAGGSINQVNTGAAAAPGTALFFTRVYSRGVANDAIELYNPLNGTTIDFTGWFLSNGEITQPIGVANNVWSVLEPFEKVTLRRNEPGSFTFSLDYDTKLALYRPDLAKVEQIAWWRNDLAWPDSCMTRSPETAGSHDGNDWVTSGGDAFNYAFGPVRYEQCTIQAPAVSVGGTTYTIAFVGAVPNPAVGAASPVLRFTVPGREGQSPVVVRIALYNVAGRLVRTVVDGALPPGEHRVLLPRRDGRDRPIAAGMYFARLSIGEQYLNRNVVLLP